MSIERALPRAVWWSTVGWSALLVSVLLWPLHRAGYLLGHDMVFTPGQPLDLNSIGAGPAPRSA